MRYDPWNILRRLTDPFVRASCVFEADLSRPRPTIPHNADLVVRLFRGSDDLQAATEALVPAGLTPEDVSTRMRKGDLVAVGFLNGTPAAYTWTRFGDTSAKELGLTIHPRTREVIQYDSLVLKPFRRRGLQFAISAPVLDYLQQNGYATALAWVNLLNRPSYKNQRKWGKKLIMTIVSIKLPGMQRRNVSLGAPLDCLFTKSSAGIELLPSASAIKKS
jgi:hypothetical protein